MKSFVTTGRIADGKLLLRNRTRMDAELKRWRDCEVTVTVERAHATRSTAQNALYWGVYVETVVDCTGYSPNEAHEILKASCLPRETAEAGENGRLMNGLVIGGSTAKLNKVEFSDYLRECRIWIRDRFDVDVPEADRKVA